MPRFYFNLYNDLVTTDEEGAELPDHAAARERAVDELRAILCAEVAKGRINMGWRIEVVDEAGGIAPVFVRDALTVED